MSKRLTEYERDHMTQRVDALLKRRKQMARFPVVDTTEMFKVWKGLVEPELKHSIEYLMNSHLGANLLSTYNYIDLNVAGYTIGIYSAYRPWRTSSDGLLVPDAHPLWKELKEFADIRYRTDHESTGARKWATELIEVSNAAGQLKRAWPELASILGDDAADSIKTVQRQSRLPPGWDEYEFNKERDTLNRVLAEAHILPEEYDGRMTFTVRKKPT